MSDAAQPTQNHWAALTAAATAAVVLGFASTILIVIEGARAVGANAAQQASAAAILCFAMAATSAWLAIRHRMPIMVAWSTPGSVLIATSTGGITWPEAIGAFVFTGVLMLLTGLVAPLERAIERMPPAIAGAMLAGVLLHYVLGVPGAALATPVLVLPLVIAFFALRFLVPMYAVPVVVVLGLALAALNGGAAQDVHLGFTPLVFVWPEWNWQAIISLGLPLYLVTMASQNLPGFAVLKANGYQPPVADCLKVTGLASVLAAPFGSHAVNMAAITASLVAGPDTHPDPAQRWKMIYPYVVLYVVIGFAAGTFVSLLGAMPREIVAAVAGLALFGPFMGGVSGMMKDAKDIEPALVTFLVTASGITIMGVGSAFWGLLAGLALWGIRRFVI